MSSFETGQMSAVETGQMSAAETGQMSDSGKLWLCLGVRCFSGAPRRGLTRGEESEEGGTVSGRRRTEQTSPSIFRCF